jgi:uncharacterized membrane protein YfcA
MLALICALAAAGLAGFSRGYAAFGTAIIYVPVMTLAYDVRTAVVTLFLVDLGPALPLVWRAAPGCDWRTIGWMGTGAAALSPVGVALLRVADEAQAQLAVGAILVAAVSLMILRPSLRFRGSPAGDMAAGAVAGLAGGLCGIFGPPATLYLIGRSADARASRADLIVFLSGESLLLGGTYLAYGMYRLPDVELAVLLAPAYGFCLWCGTRSFARTGEAAYRRIVLWFLWAISALLVLRSAVALA